MLETIAIISNGIVVVAIGILWRKVDKQEECLNTHVINSTNDLNDHIVNFTEAVTNRPDFDQVERKICAKLKPIKNDLYEAKEKLFDHLLEAKK